MTADCLIIGAGVAGLGAAWNLARAGIAVMVIDAHHPGAGASSAAAGMLAAEMEMGEGGAGLAALGHAARAAWPAYAAALEQASGIGIDLRLDGAIAATFEAEPGQMGPEAARAIEPGLARNIAGARWAPGDGSVDPRAVVRALAQAASGAGVAIRHGLRASALRWRDGRVAGVMTDLGAIDAAETVVAAGAWSSAIDGLPGTMPAVAPVKGQMLALQAPADAMPVHRIVWGPGVYIVPRSDGRILIGATVEDAGFDVAIDSVTIGRLKEAAERVVPGLRGLPVVETWAGLRPKAGAGLPVCGRAAPGLVAATGQYRNGILYLPVMALSTAAAVLGQSGPAVMAPFAPVMPGTGTA